MTDRPDSFEESACIVEAFAAGETGEAFELLARIAQAIPDHAIDN